MKHTISATILRGVAIAVLTSTFAHAQYLTHGRGDQGQAAFQAQMQRMQELQRQQEEYWARIRAQSEALVQLQRRQAEAARASSQAQSKSAQQQVADVVNRVFIPLTVKASPSQTSSASVSVDQSGAGMARHMLPISPSNSMVVPADQGSLPAVPIKLERASQSNSGSNVTFVASSTRPTVNVERPSQSSSGASVRPGESGWLSALTQSRLTAEQLADWSFADLRKGINYLYAMKGFPFASAKSAPLRAVFMKESWYQPVEGMTTDEADARMTEVEADNIKLMAQLKSQMTPE